MFGQNKNKPDENYHIVKHIDFDGLDIELNIHPAQSRSVIIIYPGADGSIDGYNQKYFKIANMLQLKNIASVVRIDNKYCTANLPYIETMIAKLVFVIEHIYENADNLFSKKDIELSLVGVSAAAGAIATVLEEFYQVKKVLFIAPADSIDRENIARGLKNYTGELYITAGEDDEIDTADVGKLCLEMSPASAKKMIEIIPNCDHQFTGKRNGMILSNAFLWAFSEVSNFPEPTGGLVLYE